jgi:predicted dehydrogenase
MLRVAIVGCGKIADQHVEQMVHIPGCQIVALCDSEELMVRQLQERINVPLSFLRVEDLLEQAKPDVVHITTSPQSHYSIGKLCLEAGCHVYIEKPFTIDYTETVDLVNLAKRNNRKLTAGHDGQFKPAAQEMRKVVAAGFLGGPPVHLESCYFYDLSDVTFAKGLLANSEHWVRKLPGGLLQNTISHGIAKIAEFLTGDDLEVVVLGYTSALLASIGETEIIDELRVIIRDATTSAYFTFSSQVHPALRLFRIYGPKNCLIVDELQQTLIKVRGKPYKSYLEQFVPPWNHAKQYIGNASRNIYRFLKADFHMSYGMRSLIRAFYQSITDDGPVPIPYTEILQTARIMDEIFSQLKSSQTTTIQSRNLPVAESCR